MHKMPFGLLPMLAVLAGLCTHCDSNYKSERSLEKETSDYAPFSNTSADTLTTQAASSGSRQFVRTADLKFRVKDVAHTTHAIENLTYRYGGFITQNHLSSSVISTGTIQITADSLLESTEYVVENNLSLRVPNQNLDSLLHQLSQQVHFLDYRIVKAADVSLQLLENKLRIDRTTQAERRYEKAIDSRGRKLGESIQGEYDRLALQQETDQRTIRNVSLSDQIHYSTLTIHIYQPATTVQEKLVAPASPPIYEPALSVRLADAFLQGWKIFEAVLVLFTQLWALWIVGLLVWLGYRRWRVGLFSK